MDFSSYLNEMNDHKNIKITSEITGMSGKKYKVETIFSGKKFLTSSNIPHHKEAFTDTNLKSALETHKESLMFGSLQ